MESKFFAEFEFRTGGDESILWFPILINEETIANAQKLKLKIDSILIRKYEIIDSYDVVIYKEPMYSAALRKYILKKRRAEILKLSLNQLTLEHLFEKKRYISFNQHIVIVPQNLLLIYKHITEMHLDALSFLTTQFSSNLDYEKEFLVLRIY